MWGGLWMIQWGVWVILVCTPLGGRTFRSLSLPPFGARRWSTSDHSVLVVEMSGRQVVVTHASRSLSETKQHSADQKGSTRNHLSVQAYMLVSTWLVISHGDRPQETHTTALIKAPEWAGLIFAVPTNEAAWVWLNNFLDSWEGDSLSSCTRTKATGWKRQQQHPKKSQCSKNTS